MPGCHNDGHAPTILIDDRSTTQVPSHKPRGHTRSMAEVVHLEEVVTKQVDQLNDDFPNLR